MWVRLPPALLLHKMSKDIPNSNNRLSQIGEAFDFAPKNPADSVEGRNWEVQRTCENSPEDLENSHHAIILNRRDMRCLSDL